MGGLYLTDLADVVRRAGLTVTEVGSGPSQTGTAWKTRARGSGGYSSGRPNAVMVHHTASGASADGWGDANYCTFSDSDKPLCNLYLSRKGQVWVCAAGATNTNGSGGPLGPVPKDSMNSCAIGIEAGNNGTGEPWPDVQQDAYVTLASALCSAYGIPTSQVYSHAEWAPSRKVDPAGPSRWAKSGTWPMDPFRSDVAGGGGALDIGVNDMLQMFTVPDGKSPATTFVTNGVWYRVLPTQDAISAMTVMLATAGMANNVGTLNKGQLAAAGCYVSPEGQMGANNPYV
jgi:hypothetical protein